MPKTHKPRGGKVLELHQTLEQRGTALKAVARRVDPELAADVEKMFAQARAKGQSTVEIPASWGEHPALAPLEQLLDRAQDVRELAPEKGRRYTAWARTWHRLSLEAGLLGIWPCEDRRDSRRTAEQIKAEAAVLKVDLDAMVADTMAVGSGPQMTVATLASDIALAMFIRRLRQHLDDCILIAEPPVREPA